VVVTNQVTTKHTQEGSSGAKDADGYGGSDGDLAPALGNTWSHCVNTRLLLDASAHSMGTAGGGGDDMEGGGMEGHTGEQSVRRMTIAKSPVAASVSVHYSIQAGGVEEYTLLEADCEHTAPPGSTREHANASMMRVNSLSLVPGGGAQWQQEHAAIRGRS
jgi:hypothetical protein